MSKFVTLDEAAQILDVDRRTVQRLIAAGTLQRFRGQVGDRKVYVKLAAVRELLKRRPG